MGAAGNWKPDPRTAGGRENPGNTMNFRNYLQLNFWRRGPRGQLGRMAWRQGFPDEGDRRTYLNYLATEDMFDLREPLCQVWDKFWERQIKKEADVAGR